ncbi:hypothetical protein D3C77_322250 [compost metagenome]
MIDLLLAARQNVPVLGKNRAQRVQNFRKYAVNPVVLLIQQLVQVLVKFDHLLRALHVRMQPIFMNFRFDISVFLLLLGDECALRVAQLLVGMILRRFDIARNAQQVLAQRLDVGQKHFQQAEAFFRVDQTGHIERTLLRMEEQAADLLAELLQHLAGQLLLRLDIFLSRPGQESLLQLRIHVHDLGLHHIGKAQPFAVLIAGQRLGNAGLERLDHALEVDAQLAGKRLDIFLARRMLEHFLHFAEQTVRQIRRHFFDRQHRRGGPDNVVFIVRRIHLVHLRDVRANIADIVMNRKFLARLLLFTRHKVRNVLGGDVHAVVIGVLQQLALGIRRRDQVAQIERRQRGINGQNVAVLLLEPLIAAVHVHPVIQLFQRRIAVLLDILARMLAQALVGQVDVWREQVTKRIHPIDPG